MRTFRIQAIGCVSLLLGLAAGCSTKMAADSFQADRSTGTLNSKGESLTITFNRDVASVSADRDGVNAVHAGNKVVFTQTCEPPNENSKLDFTVGAGDDESVTVTITLVGKSSSGRPSATQPFALDDNGNLQIGLLSSVQAWVRAKSGTILGVERAPANSRVSWKFHPDKKAIAITVSKEAGSEDVRDYEIKVKGENSAGEIAMVALKFKVVGQAVPFALDDDGKLELKLPQSAGQQQDTQVWVKARSGVIVRVEHAPENSKVSWKHSPEKNAIAIAVSRDAGAKDARQYAVKVRGKNGTGTIEDVVLKFKVVGPVEPFALEDDGKLQLKLNPHRESQAWVKARSGTIFRVEQAPDNSRVSWKYHPDKQMIGITVPRDVSDADAREYEITVRGKDSAGREEKVVLRFRVVGPIEPFALQDDGKLEIVLNPQATKDIQVRVQCATGAIQRVVEAPAEDAKVRWNFDAESKAIVIVVARDAGIEDVKEYTIHVRGQDGAGRPKRVALKFKVTLPLR